jgi:hypothetical protein
MHSLSSRARRLLLAAWFVLLLTASVLLVPWMFEGEVFTPGSREPTQVSLSDRRWAPLFAPPEVDPEALGLGTADERFQIRLHPVVDSAGLSLQVGGVLLLGLVAVVVAWRRRRV